jgi:hypothetical protein
MFFGTGLRSFVSKIEAFKARRQQWGTKRAVYWELMHGIRILTGFRIHYVNIGTGIYNPEWLDLPELPNGYENRFICTEALLPYVDKTPELDAQFLSNAIANGDECFATFFKDQLIGFKFSTRVRAPVTDQLDILVPTGFIYAYKDWTNIQHRNLSLSKYRSKAMDSVYLAPRNTERFIWYIETHNYASLLHSYIHPRDQALKSGFIGWYSFFGRQIPFNSRKAKSLGCEIVKRTDSGARQYI